MEQVENTPKKIQVRKCPNCGDPIDIYEVVCDHCGYEFGKKEKEVNSSIQELSAALHKMDVDFQSGNWKEKLDDSALIKQKADYIRNYPVPTTKEDIIDFMIYASANVDENYSNGELSVAWKSKLDQAYQKAQISFGNSSDFKRVEKLYNDKETGIKKGKKHYAIETVLALIVVIVMVIGGLFIASNPDILKLKNKEETTDDVASISDEIDATEQDNQSKDIVNITNETTEATGNMAEQSTKVTVATSVDDRYVPGDMYTDSIKDVSFEIPSNYNLKQTSEGNDVKAYIKDNIVTFLVMSSPISSSEKDALKNANSSLDGVFKNDVNAMFKGCEIDTVKRIDTSNLTLFKEKENVCIAYHYKINDIDFIAYADYFVLKDGLAVYSIFIQRVSENDYLPEWKYILNSMKAIE